MRRFGDGFLTIWAAFACAVALFGGTEEHIARKPVLVVLPFASEFDGGKMGRVVTSSLRRKFERKWIYQAVEDSAVDEVLQQEGFKATFDSSPAAVAKFASANLGARFVVWGKVEREGDGFRIFTRAMDLETSGENLAHDLSHQSPDVRAVPLICQEIVDTISGDEKSKETEPTVPPERRRPEPRVNLVKNGDFEQGQPWHPLGWQKVDNLTTFWVEEGKSGKCIKMDTDVYEREVLPWREKLQAGANPANAPKKTPTSGHKYDTIGGTYGVQYYSDPIPVKPGVIYRIDVDMKGRWCGIFFPKAFVKGYDMYEDKELGPQYREMYNTYLACRPETQGREYEHFTRTFLPTGYFVVYDFRSAFDNDASGKAAAEAIRERAAKSGFPMVPIEIQRRITGERGFRAEWDMPVQEIAYFTREKLKGHAAVWGRVVKDEEGKPRIEIRVTDVRQKRLQPLIEAAHPLPSLTNFGRAPDAIIQEIRTKIRFVQFIRVMLYAYWPPYVYHWDNIRITEEGDALW